MIRSLSRGLDILSIFNKRDSASAADIAKELKMPRSSVYRILGTLIEKNFIYQHNSDKRFRLTQKIRSLSDGYTDEDHMANIGRDFLERFTKKHNWPATLATISGLELVVRENTDQISPFAVEKFTVGYRMPILNTASGLCILAYMPIKRSELIFTTLLDTNRKTNKSILDIKSFNKKMSAIKKQGYATMNRARRFDDQIAISVPIITESQEVKGALTVRYSKSALTLKKAIQIFVPSLNKAAEGIASRINLHIDRQRRILK